MLLPYPRKAYLYPHKHRTVKLETLKEIRKMRKISIKDLSKTTGINRDRISLIERGLVNPSFKSVIDIAEAIGANIVITL